MGAWDHGSFDNDIAADWAGDLVDDGTPQMVIDALEAVAGRPSGKYFDSDLGMEGLAAAEVVAAAAGRPGEESAYSEGLLEWSEAHRELGVVELRVTAIAALDRITGPDSELRDLWLEDDTEATDHPWLAAVAELRARLSA